jgi:hypothetical protein
MKTNNEDLGINATGKKTMTRKEAISRAGFMAISAATTMMLLSVSKAAHASTPAPAAPTDEPTGGGKWIKRT